MVDLNTHKMLAMASLDDDLAPSLSNKAGDAYWRGFLVEDRATGMISFMHRFKYTDTATWYEIKFVQPRESLEALVEEVKFKMASALLTIAKKVVPDVGPEAFEWRDVPVEDRDDAKRTMIWMEMQDLVHEPRFEKGSTHES